jgi:hypothetical protein
MASNLETNGPANVLLIARQAREWVEQHHPEDRELLGMLGDVIDAADRWTAYTYILQQAGQRMLITYSDYVTRLYRPRGGEG